MSETDHPAHYGGDTEYEAIKVMEAWHGPEAVRWFCILSAEKYFSRAGKKIGESMAKDLRKAAWYTEYAAKLAERIPSSCAKKMSSGLDCRAVLTHNKELWCMVCACANP